MEGRCELCGEMKEFVSIQGFRWDWRDVNRPFRGSMAMLGDWRNVDMPGRNTNLIYQSENKGKTLLTVA